MRKRGLLYKPVDYSTDRSKAVVPVLVLLFVALWFILRGYLFYVLPCVILFLCFFSPFSTAITSLGEERANLSAFHTFIRFALVWFCPFSLLLGVWKTASIHGRRAADIQDGRGADKTGRTGSSRHRGDTGRAGNNRHNNRSEAADTPASVICFPPCQIQWCQLEWSVANGVAHPFRLF